MHIPTIMCLSYIPYQKVGGVCLQPYLMSQWQKYTEMSKLACPCKASVTESPIHGIICKAIGLRNGNPLVIEPFSYVIHIDLTCSFTHSDGYKKPCEGRPKNVLPNHPCCPQEIFTKVIINYFIYCFFYLFLYFIMYTFKLYLAIVF